MVLAVSSALPGDEFVLVTVVGGYGLSKPGRADAPPPTWHQQRMPGPHGFAVRFNIGRLRAVRSLTGLAQSKTRPAITHAPNAAASTASRPASMTMANAPLWDGTAGDIDLSRVRRKQEYFCKRGWTGKITLNRFNKLPWRRKRVRRVPIRRSRSGARIVEPPLARLDPTHDALM